jgi:hypothetical protein
MYAPMPSDTAYCTHAHCVQTYDCAIRDDCEYNEWAQHQYENFLLWMVLCWMRFPLFLITMILIKCHTDRGLWFYPTGFG